MRSILAIVIAIFVALPTFSPLLALASGDDPGRPACCRRDGKHHCMLMDMEASPPAGRSSISAPSVSERCPYGAKLVPSSPHADWTLDTARAIFAGVAAHPSIAPQTESRRRISADRSRHKRGPPAPSLA